MYTTYYTYKIFRHSFFNPLSLLSPYSLPQVNGVDVVSLKMVEVEDIMHESSHITLTLLGKLAQNGTRGIYSQYTCGQGSRVRGQYYMHERLK